MLFEHQTPTTAGISTRSVTPPRVGFAVGLEAHGERTALIFSDGTSMSYRDLALHADSTLEPLRDGRRRLVMVETSNDLEPLAAYLGALRDGHPVLLAPADDRDLIDVLTSTYRPDAVFTRERHGWRWRHDAPETPHHLYPDLALLMCTSGSTGSPKLVRLSHENLQSNCDAIAECLEITDRDRVATSLPMHYCYGLSVINSNLSRGATLILTNESVVDQCFWARFQEHQATSFAGVPYTFDLLDRAGFDQMELPHLRYITQAGGRLAAEKVERFARRGQAKGWQLFVMYGQTEATARMAYLPPDLAASNPTTIGIPIAGGSFEIEVGSEAGRHADEGPLLYRGPNVMLGYAHGPSDLSMGRTVERLRTGDIARRTPDGLYELTGRESRFVKLFGLRIDLEAIEALLLAHDVDAVCTGDDERLVIATTAIEVGNARIQQLVRQRCGLPSSCVKVCRFGEIPRLLSGKPDYMEIDRRAAIDISTTESRSLTSTSALVQPPTTNTGRTPLRAAFSEIFETDCLHDDSTFVSLGGDSLSYVEMSIAIEDALGHVPPNWHQMTLAQLESRASTPRKRVRAIETSVLLRALATMLVVGSHAGLYHLLGGAHLLLAVSGWNFARFTLSHGGRSSSTMFRSILHIAVPSVLWIGCHALLSDQYDFTNALLFDNYVDGGGFMYWYLDVLVQTLLMAALILSIPYVEQLERSRPWPFACAVLGAGLLARFTVAGFGQPAKEIFVTHVVVWLFALGWTAQQATTVPKKLGVLVVGTASLYGFFGSPEREGVVAAGLALLLFVPVVKVPNWTARPIATVATASLHIYLVHIALFPALQPHLPPLAVAVICVAVGVCASSAAERVTSLLKQFLRARRASESSESSESSPQRGISTASSGGSRRSGSLSLS